jgi:hypothetical protein
MLWKDTNTVLRRLKCVANGLDIQYVRGANAIGKKYSYSTLATVLHRAFVGM